MYSEWFRTHLKKLSILALFLKWNKEMMERTGDGRPGKELAGNVIAGCKYLKGYCGE